MIPADFGKRIESSFRATATGLPSGCLQGLARIFRASSGSSSLARLKQLCLWPHHLGRLPFAKSRARHQAETKRQATGPASGGATGSRETDAVLNTSAVVAFWLGIESGSRRDQAGTLVIGSFAEGRCGFRRCSRQRLDYAIFGFVLLSSYWQWFL